MVVEYVFNFPGIGQGLVYAVNDRDIPVIQFIVLVLAAFYVVMNIVTDVIALLATPRRRIAEVAHDRRRPRAARPHGRPRGHVRRTSGSCCCGRRSAPRAARSGSRSRCRLSCWSRSSARSSPRTRPTRWSRVPFAKPSGQFPLGGDFLGRDVLSRVLAGGWVLLVMAAAATALGIVAGAAAGISAAYLRGWPRRHHHADRST